MIPLLAFSSIAFAVEDAWPDLPIAAGKPNPDSQDAALIITIEDYAFVADIEGANRNGQDWYRFLTQTQGIPASKVKWLQDANGSKEKIFTSALELVDSTGEDGRLWLVFVGHGAPSQDGTDGMLVGVDAQQDAEGLYSRSISQTKLLSILEGGKQSETIAVIDACFSGQSDDGALAPGLQPLIATADLQTGAVTVLSAGKNDQFAGPLPGASRPAFSYLALGAMTGWADGDGDEKVTAQEAVDYTKQALESTLLGRQQTPQLYTSAMDTVLGTGSVGSPDFSEINLKVKEWEVLKKEEEARAAELMAKPPSRMKSTPLTMTSFGVGAAMLAGTGLMAAKISQTKAEALDLPLDQQQRFTALEEQLETQQTTAAILGISGAASIGVGLIFSFK